MISLKARQLLVQLAKNYQYQTMLFSKSEISKKINEIKYLSAQKQIPRLSLRKEINHLEIQLSRILELEQRMTQQKKYESYKINLLRKENRMLKQRLAAAADKDLHHKVDKLSHHLGEYLSKNETKKNVLFASSKHNVSSRVKLTDSLTVTPTDYNKMHLLHQRLEALKQELQIKKMSDLEPEKMKMIEEKIKQLEEKINLVSSCPFPAQLEKNASDSTLEQNTPNRHQILFPSPEHNLSEHEIKKQLFLNKDSLNPSKEKELPFPPPPRMIKVQAKELRLSPSVQSTIHLSP